MLHKATLQRLSVVTKVLVQEGSGYLVDQLELRAHLPFVHRLLKTRFEQVASNPERVRRILERLGATYVKLGQLLSIRPDLVPSAYSEEFRKLQDRMPPLSYATIKSIIEEELHKSTASVFSSIEKEPMGSASVAQVHRAQLKDSRDRVVIKVQRPNIAKDFVADIEVMQFIAHRMEKNLKGLKFSPSAIVREFERYTMQEMDFLREGDFVEKFERRFEGSEFVKIPHCYEEYTTKRMLVLEELKGQKLSDMIAKKGVHIPNVVTQNLMELAMQQFFHMDVFHADVHPGNVMVLRDGRIGLLDFGIVGSMLPQVREQAVRMYLALIDKDVKSAESALLALATTSRDVDIAKFRSKVRSVIEEWHSGSTRGQRVTHQMHKLLDVCEDSGVDLPTDLVRLAKALVTIEATCLQVDPSFDFVERSKPYIAQVLTSELKSTTRLREVLKRSFSIKQFLEEFPRQVMSTLQSIERADFKIDIADEDVKNIGRRLYLSADRLSLAMLSGAFVIAGGLIMQVSIEPLWQGYSVLGVVAFILALILAMFLVYDFYAQR